MSDAFLPEAPSKADARFYMSRSTYPSNGARSVHLDWLSTNGFLCRRPAMIMRQRWQGRLSEVTCRECLKRAVRVWPEFFPLVKS